MFCIKSACLVDEEDFLFSLVSGSDSGAAIGDGADLEFHFWILGGGFQYRIGLQGPIDLIAVYLCVAVIIIAEDSHLGAVLCCPTGQGVHGVKETSPKSPPRPLPDLAPDTKVPRILHSNGP